MTQWWVLGVFQSGLPILYPFREQFRPSILEILQRRLPISYFLLEGLCARETDCGGKGFGLETDGKL